jgi:hypothetical protein
MPCQWARHLVRDQEVEGSNLFAPTILTRICTLRNYLHSAECQFSRGNKGALRIPILSFQYLRRPGRATKLLCFHTAGGFAPHHLFDLSFGSVRTYRKQTGAIRGHLNPGEPVESPHNGQLVIPNQKGARTNPSVAIVSRWMTIPSAIRDVHEPKSRDDCQKLTKRNGIRCYKLKVYCEVAAL